MTIVFNGRFSAGADFDDYYAVDPLGTPTAGGVAGVYEFASDPTGNGNTVAKLTLAPGNPGRVELRPYEKDIAGAGPVWGERWYAWWTYFASFTPPVSQSVDADDSRLSNSRLNLAQSHDTADGGDTTHLPPWILFIDQDGVYKLATTYDTNATTGSRVPNLRVFGRLPLVVGQWDEWVLRMNLAYDATGFAHFYRNRRLQYSITGVPTQYNDTVGPFFKSGLYSYGAKSYVIYHDGIVIGDASSSYLEVTGNSLLEVAMIRGIV